MLTVTPKWRNHTKLCFSCTV